MAPALKRRFKECDVHSVSCASGTAQGAVTSLVGPPVRDLTSGCAPVADSCSRKLKRGSWAGKGGFAGLAATPMSSHPLGWLYDRAE